MTNEQALRDYGDVSFEEALTRLEQIVKSLEDGREVSLEEMINAYSEGLRLSKICQQKLNEAELQIKEITEEVEEEAEEL